MTIYKKRVCGLSNWPLSHLPSSLDQLCSLMSSPFSQNGETKFKLRNPNTMDQYEGQGAWLLGDWEELECLAIFCVACWVCIPISVRSQGPWDTIWHFSTVTPKVGFIFPRLLSSVGCHPWSTYQGSMLLLLHYLGFHACGSTTASTKMVCLIESIF